MSAGGAWDVAVVGGGFAGVAAAVTAARSGARTLLLEQADVLGGNVSQALVHTICGLFAEGGTAEPANPGLPLRFVDGLARAGGAGAPERVGRVWVVPIEPAAAAAHAARLCAAEPRLETQTGVRVQAAALPLAPGAVGRLLLRAGAGEVRPVEARVVVDASGDGEVGALAGADVAVAAPETRQICSYVFRLRGVPASALDGFGRLRLTAETARAGQEGGLPPGLEAVLLRPAGAPGEAFVTVNLPRALAEPADLLTGSTRLRLKAIGDAWADAVCEHLRRLDDRLARCQVAARPAAVGVREGRQLLGPVVLDRDDVVAGRRRDDEVARSVWPIELWQDHRRATMIHPAGPSSIPLGALASRSHPTLAMAGRCLSATHEALGALRVLGTALATGAAAGRAAALAAERGCALGDVSPAAVRDAALGDGA